MATPATGQAFINPLRAHPPNDSGWEVEEHLLTCTLKQY